MRKVIHIVRMWPTAEDPQHGGFIVSHVRALADHAEQRILIWDGKWNATPLYAEEFSLAQPTTPGFRAKWRALREWLDAELPHVVHVHGAGNDSALAFLLLHLLHGSRIRRVVTEHQSHWADGAKLGMIWTLRLAHARTAVSGWLASLMQPYSAGAAISVVPNILTAPNLPLQRSDAAHRRFLWVGDLVPLKGLPPLLEAWARHHRTFPHDHLSLMGGTAETGLHSDQVPEGATYCGPARAEEVQARMLHHDILVVNSERETFSMVIGEALERGLSVLCTPIPGPQSVYSGDGITYRADHSEDNLVQELGRAEKWADRAVVLDAFRAETVAQQFLALYAPEKKKGLE